MIGTALLRAGIVASVLLASFACGRNDTPATAPTSEGEATAAPAAAPVATAPGANPDRNAYFGDLHVHTELSFDAYLFGTRRTPDDAYRFAKGEAIEHAAGFRMQLRAPLDFQAVTDHDMFLGIMPAMADPTTKVSQHPAAAPFKSARTVAERAAAFASIREFLSGDRWKELLDEEVVRSAWKDVIDAAERHNDPGRFTTFIGYEYTSGPESQNLHRNVIFRGSKAAELPFTRLESQNPEDLWAWMDRQREAGIESLAIPHNSNGSNGQMFRTVDFAGNALTEAYAEQRMRNEPLVEVTQVKGTSDTHPMLSPNDEWAEFEIMSLRIGSRLPSDVPGSYVREAYLNGLSLDAEQGFNPYRFGLVGSSDTHNAAGSFDESDFHSKVGLLDATPQRRGSVPLDTPGPNGDPYADTYYRFWSASGLAGVWAEENTREAIFDALRRKETFATTGPRMKVRFFGGWELGDDLLNDPAMVREAYARGVAMGGDLLARPGATPSFLVWAVRDARSAGLQRVQVIKGWLDGAVAREQVFDVACSDGGVPDASTHRCPDNGAQVDLGTCAITDGVGADELKTLWRDPDFDAAERAFYYVRVLENPTCRWSTWDAIRAGVAPRPGLPSTIQERAWSSPISYVPAAT